MYRYHFSYRNVFTKFLTLITSKPLHFLNSFVTIKIIIAVIIWDTATSADDITEQITKKKNKLVLSCLENRYQGLSKLNRLINMLIDDCMHQYKMWQNGKEINQMHAFMAQTGSDSNTTELVWQET